MNLENLENLEPVPILAYHALATGPRPDRLAPAAFREHMRVLSDRGFQGIGFGSLVSAWRERRPPTDGRRPVVLTFDDGYRNTLTEAADVLARHGFGATVFAIAGKAGGVSDWHPEGDRLPLMSWAELREWRAAGFEVGSHGVGHLPMNALSPADLHSELAVSRQRLEQELGAAVPTLCYPYGAITPRVLGAAAGHYQAACTTEMGYARPDHPPLALPRIDVHYLRHPRHMARLGTPPGRAWLSVRKVVREAHILALRVAGR